MGKEISWFGIDFGTTNSAVSSMTGASKANCVQINHGDDLGRPFPSIAAIHKKTGEVITGRDAKERRNELSTEYEYFSSIKTIIASKEKYEVGGKTWTPVDIAAEIFKGLKANIEKRAHECKEAIVAVPIGFSPKKKANIRKAAKLAGIDVKMFVSEPTAAFCSNYVQLKMFKNVAVFDWGGGTLDVAILKVENGKVFEIATEGMTMAGDDIDRKIAEKMHIKFCKNKGVSIPFEEMDSIAKDQLIMKSELAKIQLSDGEDLARVAVLKYGELGVARDTIDYDYFSLLVEPEVNAALACLEKAIKKANLNETNLDCILCVGGSSKLRPFKEKLIDKYGQELVYYPDMVMWDIAKGASIINVTDGGYGLNQDLGVIMSNGEFYPMIQKGQLLPCKEKRLNFAIVNDEKVAKFIVTDNENPEQRTFEQFISIDRKGQGFMSEQFEVSCFIDPDLLFRFRVRSSEFMHQYLYLWTYDGLKVYYQLEGKKNGRGKK
jgi:molecular chaperone DnaK